MKIILVHQYFNISKGGFRTYSFAKYLVEKGHSVIVITSNRDNPEWRAVEKKKIDNIEILYIKNSYSNSMGFIRRIYSFIRFMLLSVKYVLKIKDADLIYATSTPLTVALPGLVYKLRYKKPFIFEVRDLWPDLPVAMGVIRCKLLIYFLKYIEKKIYFYSDKIITLSPGMQDGVVKRGFPIEKTCIISNGCDIKILNEGNDDIIDIPGINKTDLKLIYAGNFGLANGLNYIIDFAKYLKEINVDYIKFILIGDGMKKEEILGLTKEYDLDNVLIFDYMPKDLVRKFIKASDLGMQILADIPAFYYGTSPNKFFDYIALSKPVFNNYPGWLAEMINEYDCGCVVNSYDYSDSFKKLQRYYLDRELINKQGENAFKLAKDKFDRIKLAERLERVFIEVTKS